MAGKNEQKAGFTSCLCLFFISIFLCASMEFHYIFPPPTPLLQHPLPLLCQCSCLTTPRISSPKMFSNMPSLSNNQKFFSSSCVVPRNLFFTSRSRRSYLGGMGGLARQTPSSSRWLTQMSSIYRKQVLFFPSDSNMQMSGDEWKSEIARPAHPQKQGHLTVLRHRL